MEVFQPLADFYDTIEGDARISATHICLYVALLQKSNASGGTNPLVVVRNELMKKAKISARHTYNKHMNELREFGYIKYLPSSNPYQGSIVYLNPL